MSFPVLHLFIKQWLIYKKHQIEKKKKKTDDQLLLKYLNTSKFTIIPERNHAWGMCRQQGGNRKQKQMIINNLILMVIYHFVACKKNPDYCYYDYKVCPRTGPVIIR